MFCGIFFKPLSKTVRFNVLKVIPMGASDGLWKQLWLSRRTEAWHLQLDSLGIECKCSRDSPIDGYVSRYLMIKYYWINFFFIWLSHVTHDLNAKIWYECVECIRNVTKPQKQSYNLSHKNMTTSNGKTSSHILCGLTRRPNYDLSQSYYMLAKNMTTHSHMPCRIGFFLPGQVKGRHRLQGRSKHAPRAVGIVDSTLLYAPTTVYIHMTRVRSDSSVMTTPSPCARHSPPPGPSAVILWNFMT